MRYLARLLFADPTLLFIALVIAAVSVAAIAFVLSERRARALAELSEDPSMLAGQRKRLALTGGITAAVIGVAAWWIFVRVHTEPNRALIAIAIETEAGSTQWWQDSHGATELAEQLEQHLDAVGIETVPLDPDAEATLRDAGGEPEAVLAAARELEARWLIRGRVRTDKTIALELAEFSDFVMQVELELVDTETEEVFAVPDMPLRVFLWGNDPDDAVMLNAGYVADRVTMPLVATLAAREPLRRYAGDRTAMTTDDAALAGILERLFLRADSHARGLEQRTKDEEQALEREPKDAAGVPHTRLSDILAEEYFIGTAYDGRVLLLSDPKHVTVIPDQLGYSIASEGEELILADSKGRDRTQLFEHYNFYSAPAISADGRVVWTTVANHGASKSLATIDVETGEFAPTLSHATDYYTSPIPSPDGSRALFYSRAGRYAETSIELIDRDGSDRKVVVGPEEQAWLPDWAPDGRSFYIPVGAWQRIVAVDVETGARRHVLGQDPEAPAPELDEIDEPDEPEPSSPTPDPRHGPNFAHHGSPAPANPPDPATTSRFSAVSVAHDGHRLYVVEQSLDGRTWLGRFDLELAAAPAPDPAPDPSGEQPEPPKPYVRLAQIEVGRLIASPTAAIVAFEAPAFTANGDPSNSDQEILVFGPKPGQLRALTLNAVDDELAGWSRDGRSVFTIQRDRDPGSDRHPVTRVYRHDLPSD